MAPENPDITDFRKLPLKERGIHSAARIRAEMPKERVEIELISLKNSFFLNLPVIGEEEFEGDAPFWIPRYNPITGFVYSARWGRVQTRIEDERRVVVNTQDYQFIRSEIASMVKLADVPKSYKLKKLIPQELPTVEALLRQQDEIAHDYAFAGAEGNRITRLMASVTTIAEKYLQGTSVKKSNLDKMSEEIEKLIKKEGINISQTRILDDFITYLRNSATKVREKSNSLISRTRVKAAFLTLVRREVSNHLIRDKANRIFWIAFGERAQTRSDFEETKEILGQLISQRKVPSLNDLKEIRSLAFDKVKVAPYNISAAIAQVMLRNDAEYDHPLQERIKRTILYRGFRFLYDLPSMDKLIKEGDNEAIFDRLKQVKELLLAVLEDPDNYEITVFR